MDLVLERLLAIWNQLLTFALVGLLVVGVVRIGPALAREARDFWRDIRSMPRTRRMILAAIAVVAVIATVISLVDPELERELLGTQGK